MRLQTKQYIVATTTVLLSAGVIVRGARSDRPTYLWSVDASLSTPRRGACAARLPDGSIMISGGHGPHGTLNTAEVLSASGTMRSIAPMMNTRADHVCTALPDGRVLVAGGATDGGGATNAAEIYDPEAQTWSDAGTMLAARVAATASTLQPLACVKLRMRDESAGVVQNGMQ